MDKSSFVPADVKKTILSHMPKAMRNQLSDGKPFSVVIKRYGKHLKRWGENENTAKIVLSGENCKILENSLVELAWSENEDHARDEARNALSYFIYGNENEYEINFA